MLGFPVNRCNVSDALDQFGASAFAECFCHGLALIPICRIQSNLDQFMMVEGNFDLLKHCLAEAVLARQDDGF